MADAWLDELNGAQREAATHPGGPVLVVAGAGTGKTKTLASRVAWLVSRGTSPDRILLLTFTRRAAAEMLRRAEHILGDGAADKVWGGTFHAAANRLLRQYGRALGLAPEFTVLDQADSAELMKLLREELGLGKSGRRFPKGDTLLGLYSRVVNSRARLTEVLQTHYPWCRDEADGIRQVFESYTRRKREQHLLDYDDLLLYWKALLAAPGVGEAVADRFDHILVDEYQDTNLLQAEILHAMRRTRTEVMAVGDDAQSIYSFRAATIRNILDFPRQFPGAAVIALEQNYRSTQPILNASNAVMARAKERYTKNLFTRKGAGEKPTITTCMDEEEQSALVCGRVLARREEGTALREQAVLFRAGHHSAHLEIELARRNIPFVKYGGLKFIEAAHVKDMLALLRLLENPADELSWFRVLQFFPGVGPGGARTLIVALGVRAGAGRAPEAQETLPADGNATGPLQRLVRGPVNLPSAAREEFEALRAAVSDCLADLPPAAQVERLRKFYDPVCERLHDHPQARLRDLDQLEQIAARYPTRRQFITDLTLDPPSSTQDFAGPPLLDDDFLILSTIHSAKGCEWDAVHLLHAADGMIPSDMATGSEAEIEEERRLLYVAMTRARSALHLYFPLRYYNRGRGFTDRHSYAQLTRFIPGADLPLYERSGTVSAVPGAEPPQVEAGAPSGIESMLTDLWQ